MDTETITINGTEYRPVNTTAGVRIVIAQRGWCFVGRYERTNDEVTLTDAHVIRTWGTKNGLGEIAAGGPTATTVLDKAGTVRLAHLGIVATLDCEEAKWANKL